MPLASLFPPCSWGLTPSLPSPCPLLPPSFLSALLVSPFLPLCLDQAPRLSPVADLSSVLIPSFLHSLLFHSLSYFSLTICCPSLLIPSSISLFLFPSGSHSLPPTLLMYFPFRARAWVRSVMHTFKEMPINSGIKIILFYCHLFKNQN